MYESNNYYGTLISKLTKRVNNVPYKDSEKADVLIANLHSTDVDNMYKTLQVNKHESMRIKRKTKELNKQQKSNVDMFLLLLFNINMHSFIYFALFYKFYIYKALYFFIF